MHELYTVLEKNKSTVSKNVHKTSVHLEFRTVIRITTKIEQIVSRQTQPGHPCHGGYKAGEKFPEFSRAINLLFHKLSQQKVNVIMTFINGHSTSRLVIK